MRKKKKILVIGLLALLVIIGGLALRENFFWRLAQGALASSAGYPYEIGLKNSTIIPCFTTGYPPVCAGGSLCYTLNPLSCSFYNEVSGLPAGGDGYNALFLKLAVAEAGLYPGGSLLAGGLSPFFMDNGVLASVGGCWGCLAQADSGWEKTKLALKYFIASFGKSD